MSRLSPRPRGVRKSWKMVVPDLATIGERLRNTVALVDPDWGDPVEAQEWRKRGGELKKVVALFSNGRLLTVSYGNPYNRFALTKVPA